MDSVVIVDDDDGSHSSASGGGDRGRMMGMDDSPGWDGDKLSSSSSSSVHHHDLGPDLVVMTATIESSSTPSERRSMLMAKPTIVALRAEKHEDRGEASCAGSIELTHKDDDDDDDDSEGQAGDGADSGDQDDDSEEAMDASATVAVDGLNQMPVKSSLSASASSVPITYNHHQPSSTTPPGPPPDHLHPHLHPQSCSRSTSTSSASSSSSYSYSIHQAIHPSSRNNNSHNHNPIPTLRHSSASLSKLLQLSSSTASSAPHHPHPTITNHPSHTSPTLLQIQRYLHPSSPPSIPQSHTDHHTHAAHHPQAPTPPPNSIKFPSSSPTTCLSLSSTDHTQTSDPQRLLDHYITRWLTTKFEPDLITSHNTSSDQSLIPELDLLVGFKSITDQLNLPQLDRQQAWAALRHVYPFVRSWARPTQPGLRSNQEFVVIGIKLKRTHIGDDDDDHHHPPPPSSSDHVLQPDSSQSPSPYESNEHRWSLPFDKLNFHKPIPAVIQSSELVEYMRRRICELEEQSNVPTSQTSASRQIISIPSNPGKSKQRLKKKQPYLAHRLFRLDSRHNNSYKVGNDAAHVLGDRIWCSLIEACKMTKDKFRDGERLVASWVERMTKFEFDVICKSCKSSHTQTIETATKKIIKIVSPFHKPDCVKLFKFQPVGNFNSIVFDQAESLDGPSNYTKPGCSNKNTIPAVTLRDFKVIQITEYSDSNRREQQKGKSSQRFFGSLSTRSITMNLMCPNKNEDDRKPQSSHSNRRKQRGKSLDLSTLLISSPKQPAKVSHCKGINKSIGGVLEQLNDNIHQKRKSLNLDKLFNQHHQSIRSSFDLMNHPNHQAQDTVRSVIWLEEIMIEFNMLSLNQLKIQMKLLKIQP